MNEITQALNAIENGDLQASDNLLPLIYAELRRLAAQMLAAEKSGQTLQATALVHEAYLRIVGPEPQAWNTRGHFFGAAARAMRRILIENARRKKSLKAGGDLQRIDHDIEQLALFDDPRGDDRLLALDVALERLAAEDARSAQLVELRYFGGLTLQEASEALNVSLSTTKRDWHYARVWLRDALDSDG